MKCFSRKCNKMELRFTMRQNLLNANNWTETEYTSFSRKQNRLQSFRLIQFLSQRSRQTQQISCLIKLISNSDQKT